MLVISAVLEIAEDHIDEVTERCRAVRDASLEHEPECHHFEIYVDRDQPGRLIFNEMYTDAEAFAFHRQQPHYTEFGSVPAEWYSLALYHCDIVK
jgi:quinol monooxygenase YgiN